MSISNGSLRGISDVSTDPDLHLDLAFCYGLFIEWTLLEV
jgi:hypothetical protein